MVSYCDELGILLVPAAVPVLRSAKSPEYVLKKVLQDRFSMRRSAKAEVSALLGGDPSDECTGEDVS